MDEKLVDILGDIFDLEPEEISGDLTHEDVPLWDSLNHLKLITAIEQAYGIQFAMAEVQSIDSIAKLKAAVDAKQG
ncbi:MAG TPA: acyl carrier protein [Kiloniellaceae bacterium]|nr:acyl carrier protein [Kiloniellaceae bacterium]